jgi:hypothetical protein
MKTLGEYKTRGDHHSYFGRTIWACLDSVSALGQKLTLRAEI